MNDPFNAQMQRLLVRLCIEDKRVYALTKSLVGENQLGFTDPTATWAWSVVEQGSSTVNQLRNESDRVETHSPARLGFKDLLGDPDFRDMQYVSENLVKFARMQRFRSAYSESAEIWNTGRQEDAFDLMRRRMDEINKIVISNADREWFFEGLPARMDVRRTADIGFNKIPTGIEELDKATGGGHRRGATGVFLAYSGIGKSFALVDQGWGAARMRFKVLHVVLEGSREYIADRYDARFLAMQTSVIEKGEVSREKMDWVQREYDILKRNLVLRGTSDTRNAWTVDNLYGEVEHLYDEEGWIPDLVCCDYGDKFKADGEDERIRQKTCWAQLQRFGEYKIAPGVHPGWALWSATQAVRPDKAADEREHILYPRDVSDSYDKVKTVQLIVTLNRTVFEKQDEWIRMLIGKNRFGPEGAVIRAETDYARGAFLKIGGMRDLVKRKPPKKNAVSTPSP